MARCKECNEIYSEFYLVNGTCDDCITGKTQENEEKKISALEPSEQKKYLSEKTKKESLKNIILSTETNIDIKIDKRIKIVSAQCVLGISIFKDMFTAIRDITGGRVKSLEDGLKEATNNVLEELRQKAYENGGDAVVGIKIEHTYNNINDGSIVSVFATGTIVKLNVNIETVKYSVSS
ncbi:hypothetical protein DF188_09890 [Aliarcobacter skirrowii]|uniref:YbjQ family protein n=1 Tax=Aliarcobacter skirrowii TaxID=28200 RepID=A0A2U2BY97_9BACT|nr:MULTISPECIES: heavy metal-binding domain-containing protein [Arcobacteraceae]MDX4060442.1 heavy metal-binding domain-containing protein [Aliarcobacter skirrowii]OCL81552.1 hypothetical protein AAW30_01851 [Arcobacter porcinus]PWE19421.1 hypothetical protein DF188_09890 [Aliarcobacter skirrowii]